MWCLAKAGRREDERDEDAELDRIEEKWLLILRVLILSYYDTIS